MIYLLKHNRNNFFQNNLFKFVSVLIIIFIFSLWGGARGLFRDIVSPALSFGDYLYRTIFHVPNSFLNQNNLLEENKKLSADIEGFKINTLDYQAIQYENQELRKELKMKEADDFITASIVAKSPQIPLDTLFIDRGSKDGLKEGDLVFVGDRVLVGKVAKVSNSSGTIVLNSFPDTITYGYLARTNEPIEIKGVGGGTIEARIPIDFDIVVGDKVMLGGPLSYTAAIVGVIEQNEALGVKNVLMSLPSDISKTKIIFIRSAIRD